VRKKRVAKSSIQTEGEKKGKGKEVKYVSSSLDWEGEGEKSNAYRPSSHSIACKRGGGKRQILAFRFRIIKEKEEKEKKTFEQNKKKCSSSFTVWYIATKPRSLEPGGGKGKEKSPFSSSDHGDQSKKKKKRKRKACRNFETGPRRKSRSCTQAGPAFQEERKEKKKIP